MFSNVKINTKKYSGIKGNNSFKLSHKEVQLIKLLNDHNNQPLDRDTILETVWGVKYEGTTRTLDQHIAKLRQKIEDNPSDPSSIITVHGIGYQANF